MPFQYKTGTFNTATSTGHQSVTGIGFQPRLLIFDLFVTPVVINTFRSDCIYSFGFGASASNQRAYMIYDADNNAFADVDTGWDTSSLFIHGVGSSDFLFKCNLVSLDADGFTINWTSTSIVSQTLHYFAFGGSDIENVSVGHFNAPSSTGDNSVTGVGFIPDFVFLLGTNHTTDDVYLTEADGFGSFCMGCFNGVGEQGVCSVIEENNVDTMDNARYQRTNKCLAMFNTTNAAALTHEASFVGMDNDGFTLNYTTASSAGKRVMYAAIKGCATKIGTMTSPTAGTVPVTQQTTGLGLDPRAVMFMSVGGTSTISIQANMRFVFGQASATDSQACIWDGSTDNVATSVTASRLDTNQCIRVSTEAVSSSSSTTQALADFISLDVDGFTLEWDVIDTSNAYEIIYIAFADSEAPEPILTNSISSSNAPAGGVFDSLGTLQADAEYIHTVMG